MNELWNELNRLVTTLTTLQGDHLVEVANSTVHPDADPEYTEQLVNYAIEMLPGQLENLLEKYRP